MFTHVMVGCADKEKSVAFYDATMGALGLSGQSHEGGAFYRSPEGVMFGVSLPRDGNAATYANGGTIGFKANTKTEVDAWHAAGLAYGGTCEGEPGPREFGEIPVYGAYMRDPTGNKLCAYVMGDAAK